MNGAVGAGVTWNIDRRILKRVNVELDAAGYYQQKGELWPYHKGIGVYSSAFVVWQLPRKDGALDLQRFHYDVWDSLFRNSIYQERGYDL